MMTPLIVGNWKMNGGGVDLAEATGLVALIEQSPIDARVALCGPATLVERMARALAGSPVLAGGQDCHPAPCGPYTGDVSAEMLADAGAGVVIVGHSERRDAYLETDAMVRAKAIAALRAGLEPVICVGESLAQREQGNAVDVVTKQVAASVPDAPAGDDTAPIPLAVAYEPIWAIGTGLIASVAQIEEMHEAIRKTLVERLGERGRGVKILYGGSVTPQNAGEILRAAEVGGALVGRASLKAADFMRIIEAAHWGAEVEDAHAPPALAVRV